MDLNNFWVALVFWIFLAVIVGSSFYFTRRMMKKKKQYDERYVQIDHLARSYSWMGSLVIIFIAWFLSLVVFKSFTAFWLITAIYVGHMFTYMIGSIIANNQHS